MNINYTKEQLAFRDEIREFLRNSLSTELKEKGFREAPLTRDERLGWQRTLHEHGWGAPAWPVEYGGTGWNAIQRHIFEEECAQAFAPEQLSFGIKMVAPVIQKYATQEQKDRYLPGIISGTDWWCQGYSEPGAGSDLASVKTSAIRQGDHYVVNGQKTWTTLAQHADWIFCLVRTDPDARKQAGISFLLIDMKSPGITVRPIIMLDGGHEVNEVWFDDVQVPTENLVGEENQGWTYAKYLLGHERTNIARIGRSKAALKRLKTIAARQPGNDGQPLIRDPRFRDRIAMVELELLALEITNLKLVAADAQQRAPGPEASILKIKGSEIQQALTELTATALGPYATAHVRDPRRYGEAGISDAFPEDCHNMAGHYFNYRKTTIYGGSSEIQKTIICKAILGL
ncbi:pimeloyl-CoA dehydrogenase large subunit [Pollutimonas nitritireducens]|uniref:Pimeloyl-CoA dehydrogenase large subunit n=1 Tax=Pollutimonas nitritireducens TaxID=2045209 RepID=A0A2N4UEC4_9BURK|nr:acyl-CoA dehydrogenase family protein [Pollutimonas nitritireducens]PLC53373.1 pimeloyl-CoA dehydrogenase large subunit [Pollutimonas nitritireducens]